MTARQPREILFLAHRIPFPPDRGDKIRSHHILKALRGMAPVHVGCFADDERDAGFSGALAEWTASQCLLKRRRSRVAAGVAGLAMGQPMLVSLYDDPRMKQWVERTLVERPIGAIVAFSAQMAHFVPKNLPPDIRFIMDFVDFDSAKYSAYGAGQGGPMGWINRREGRVLMDFERDVAMRAEVSTFVSEAEADLFVRIAGAVGADVRPLENGVDLQYWNAEANFEKVRPKSRPLIVFTGQMDYRPNVQAVVSFARNTFPSIRAVLDTSVFTIVGRNPAPEVEALANLPGVIVTGGVPDVRGWLAAADVVVAPLRIARGIQNKVLEAMAMGKPLVVSPQAAEGIDATAGEHFIVAPNREREADAVLSLIEDRDRAVTMGAAARRRVEERYDWAVSLAPLRGIVLGEGA
ncbi:MAG: TIGR03087 family PEP-CTERM/XrtA system glycosyltransferase [Sphingobium sp.]